MFKSIFSKWILSIIIIVILIFTFIYTPAGSWIVNISGTVVSPIQNVLHYGMESFGNLFGYWGRVKNVDVENQALLQKIDELEQNNRDYERYKQENERLRDLLNLKDNFYGIDSTAADVISKDAGNWFHVFTLNKGTSSGINKNYPVINSKGLIGRTMDVGISWSKVVSLIDSEHSVSGVISRTGDLVQIDGDLTLMKSSLCKMTVITQDADVIIGDSIETSGIGGVYPKGIHIGTVLEFRNNETGTGSYAVVKPAVDFQRIKEVMILKMPDKE